VRKRGVPHMNIAVEDSGQGLKKSDRKRIFEEFEQADTTSTREHGGAGLGLAISRRIVEAMGGELKVAARKSGGTTFTVSIPIRGAQQRGREKASALAGQSVLIVSANEMETDAISRIIEKAGGKTARATSASKAAAIVGARRKSFDTLLIDSALESKDCETISQLCDAGFAGTRAVTMIAPTDRGRLPRLFEYGYTSFLARPVRGNTLIRQLAGPASETSAPAKNTGKDEDRPNTVRGMAAMNILLAEDNPINAMLARVVLEKSGHRVTIVEDGLSAVKMCAGGKNDFDIVLMDLHMPVMDGLDAITAIRTHEEESGNPPIPILVLTADGQEETETSVFAHGADGFLTKPLDPARLISTIENRAA
jgi:CheY-like chemotaxis protein